MTLHYGLFGGLPATDDPALLAPLKGYGRGLRKPPIEGVPEIWAVARTDMADGKVLDTPMSWADIDADIAWGAKVLDEMGVARGDICFFSFLYGQSAPIWPYLKSCFDRGATVASGMPSGWDSYRHEVFLRLFRLKLMFGVSSETLDGWEAAGHDFAKVVGQAEIVAARPGAWERLVERGLKPWRVTFAGPVLIVDPCDGTGGRFDESQWTLDADAEGRILVTSNPSRETRFDRAATAATGRIETVDGHARYFSE